MVTISGSMCGRLTMIITRKPLLFTLFSSNNLLKPLSCRNIHSFHIYDDRDPAPYFFSPSIQKYLLFLTRPDYQKVFRKRLTPGQKSLSLPEYKFLTNEELNEEIKNITEKANRLLQMPPVVKIHKQTTEIISKDPAIIGHDPAKYVFTDISLNLKNKDRLVTVRDLDGSLYHGDYDLRKKVNMIYNPTVGREMKEPDMFTDENLFNNVLNRAEYEFILDKACVQYEPDDPTYQKITSSTYKHCDMNKNYQILRSTRHFGPMTFFLTWNNIIDELLLDLLSTQIVTEAIVLIHLQRLIHPKMVQVDDSKGLAEKIIELDAKKTVLDEKSQVELVKECIPCIQKYIENNSIKKASLQLLMQSFIEVFESKLKIEENIRLAHGAS